MNITRLFDVIQPKSTKFLLALLAIIISSQILDTSLNRIYTFNSNLYSSFWSLAIFALLIVVYTTTQYLILKYIRPEIRDIKIARKLHSTTLHSCLMLVQYLLVFILLLVLLQIILTSHYDTRLIIVTTGISYSITIFMMALLTQSFLSWYFHNRKTVVLFYGLATATIGINAALTFSLVYLFLIGQPFQAEQIVATVPPYLLSTNIIVYNGFIVSSITSFILAWIATVLSFITTQKYLEKAGFGC